MFAWLFVGITSILPGQIRLPDWQGPDITEPGNSGEPVVGIEGVAQYEPVAAGQRFLLAVILNVPEGWHLYANPKQGEFGQDTKIIPRPDPGFRFGRVIYPPGQEYLDEISSNHIYEGQTLCYVPMEIDSDALKSETGGTVKKVVHLDLEGQLCGGSGVCLPWKEKAEITLKVTADPAGAVAVRPELYASVDPAGAWVSDSSAMIISDDEIAPDDWLTPVVLALAAGLIMNLMPCVLPLIPIIVMTLIKQCAPAEGAQPERGKSLSIGIAFAAGILIVFAVLAIIMSGFQMLWGQHFQSNAFKFALLMVVFFFSLSMFGVFEIVLPPRISNMSIARKGYAGAFAMGMLATVLATPCGAPLLTPVLAWSLDKPTAITVTVFLIIGAGMAIPYVFLTAFPRLLARIPRGGNWMIRLKQAMGFAMLGFSAYLITRFPSAWQEPLLYFCVLVGFSVWLGFSVVNVNTPAGKRRAIRLVALVLIIGASVTLERLPKSEPADLEGAYWLDQLHTYQQQNQTVIVKFTANWCKNCSAIDKHVYKAQAFKDKLKETHAQVVIADWSNPDKEIEKMLNQLGGQALPFAAVFPGRDPGNPVILRDFYSLADALRALDQAAAR
ncbi:MAG: thioredoxin family protein [Sedimentisphaerales bacterium]|nr:thioredoxin family protein [Sedimentisphaerales bacterium]